MFIRRNDVQMSREFLVVKAAYTHNNAAGFIFGLIQVISSKAPGI